MGALLHDTVLLVCSDPRFADFALRRFYQVGYPAVGPVSSAAMALALAAQTAPRLALVAQPPTGRRNAFDLARELLRQWGIRSLVLKDAMPRGSAFSPGTHAWRPPADETDRLIGLLGLSLNRPPGTAKA